MKKKLIEKSKTPGIIKALKNDMLFSTLGFPGPFS
jgi:hypothetical protein